METLSVFQVALLRMVSAGLVILPLTFRHIRKIPANRLGYYIANRAGNGKYVKSLAVVTKN